MCVLVISSKRAQFVKRVLSEFEGTEKYRKLKDRQKKANTEVLRYILEHEQDVRFCDIQREFVGKGKVLSYNSELQRILANLEEADFIEKRRIPPNSMRPNVFFHASWSRIRLDDCMEDSYEAFKLKEDLFSAIRAVGEVMNDPIKRAEAFRNELEGTIVIGEDGKGHFDLADEEFLTYLKNIGFVYGRENINCIEWWANYSLSEDESDLKKKLIDFFRKKDKML